MVTKDNVILPESYRHLARERLLNKRLVEVAPRFAKIKTDISQQRQIEGTYFHWDSEFPGHYGHALTEQVSRLWGLQRARELYPDLKVLLGLRQRQRRPMPFELTISRSGRRLGRCH